MGTVGDIATIGIVAGIGYLAWQNWDAIQGIFKGSGSAEDPKPTPTTPEAAKLTPLDLIKDISGGWFAAIDAFNNLPNTLMANNTTTENPTPSTKLPIKASFNPTGMTAADLLQKTGIEEPTEEQLKKAEQKLKVYDFNKKLMGL